MISYAKKFLAEKNLEITATFRGVRVDKFTKKELLKIIQILVAQQVKERKSNQAFSAKLYWEKEYLEC